ncbi:MAG: Aminoglycoside N(6')-acetyltransferase type 1 [Anaerolineales bacterium]|nr:GNAT family N-acetyltransferase [Anaerolineales bacterium]MBV6400256.1 Aminoglycoside N(6')-acetyltransferase type 1 [Anaerolineales bacterium]MCC7190021.1 GNAT family N-acetyltransferase [Anaerolineales bacterium]HQU36795.1 GNAT family N-acetyltransferase [Anaerolineales bacterium]
MTYEIRRATAADKPEWLRMRQLLWPEAPIEYLDWDLDEILEDKQRAVFVASRADGGLVAFVEARLRDVAEGCETSPVGYIEAWFVDENIRGQKLGREMIRTAEDWARENGCAEMGSDTWLENEVSIQAHYKTGYYEVGRLVHFIKKL